MYDRVTPTPYPLPYPAAYPPAPPVTPPAPQTWTPRCAHRHAVCRVCNTILLALSTVPDTVRLTRYFTDDMPLSATQTLRTPPPQSNRGRRADDVTSCAALSWLHASFAGLRGHRGTLPLRTNIPLSCRACGCHVASLALLSPVVMPGDAGEGEHSCVQLSFAPWAVSLSDAYGREISAAAEACGFWNVTPPPYAGRPVG